MAQRSLESFATQAEQVAYHLYALLPHMSRLRDEGLASIRALRALAELLREVAAVLHMARSLEANKDLHDELSFLRPSLAWTLDDALDKLSRDNAVSPSTAWILYADSLEIYEGIGFLQRLQLYHTFLRAQLDAIDGFRHRSVRDLRRRLAVLKGAQEVERVRANLRAVDISGIGDSQQRSSTRVIYGPPLERRSSQRRPVSFTATSDATTTPWYNPPRRPPVPTPPPLSPTYTTTSSHTLSSTETSYSFKDPQRSSSALHWSHKIFDRDRPQTAYRSHDDSQEKSTCHGEEAPGTLQSLVRDGYVRVVELPFDERRLYVRLYWRSLDDRARIVIITRKSTGGNNFYCLPLKSLKFIRNRSAVQLCRARDGGVYQQWAKLIFDSHEKMVLFYCTFVGMKHQDRLPLPHKSLLDRKEMKSVYGGEEEQFGGQIQHGNLVHALRIFKDEPSGAVRIEASALSGPTKDLPIWTAFVTKYAHDPDWAQWEGAGRVNLAALRPPPFVFLSSYEPLTRQGEYVLNFTSTEDAKMFVECWTGLCRST